MGKRTAKVIALAALVMAVFIATFPWALYLYGLSALPDDPSPSNEPIPHDSLRILWFSMTGGSEMRMEPISLWIWAILPANGSKTLPAGYNVVAGHAARLMFDRKPNRKVSNVKRLITHAAAAIWISRNWSAEDAARTILAEGYLGHGFFGIRQAAQGYFGLSAEELSLSEVALLVVVGYAPLYYSPWCHPEQGAERARQLLAEFQPGAVYAPRVLPPPPNVCK